MITYGLDHLHLRSTDPEAAAAFYARAFGAEIVDRQHPGGKLRVIIRLAGLTLLIEAVPAGTAGPPAPPFRGLEHIGLAVDDIDAALADLAAKQIPLASGLASPRPGIRIAFVAAPDGVRVELVERKPA